MITHDLNVHINKKDVMKQIDCHEDSDFYEEISEEFDEIEKEMYSLCEPLFLLEKGVLSAEFATEEFPEGTPILMVIYSIGGKLSEYSTLSFTKGDYVKGMLADAMADSALFSLEKEFEPFLKSFCETHQMGIMRRLEAPHDIPLEAQRFVWEKTEAKEKCGIEISTGYMLNPVKSNSIIYILTEDQESFQIDHNCRKCKNYSCKMRHVPDVPVRVHTEKGELQLMVKDRQSILEALMKVEPSYTAVCGGVGKCGKCKIRILDGELQPNTFDEACFSNEELARGFRLACKAYPYEPLAIELDFKDETGFVVVTDHNGISSSKTKETEENKYIIGIDIGTTTIAVQLVNLFDSTIVLTYTTINNQRTYGADVISRIKASVEGKKEELQSAVRKNLEEGIQRVIKDSNISKDKIKEISIAGNTTMIHLLMGYDCKSLGEYPFTPVNIQPIDAPYRDVMGNDLLDVTVRIMPGISTFVGGDIVAGLYSCNIEQKKEYVLLIDLGTNGEIALGNKDKIMVTSTAAGPAFEGGNIEWGVGSIEGAIAEVSISDDGIRINTIGNKVPTGICGTGVIETVAELVRMGIIDETGCLDEDCIDEGYPLANTVDGRIIRFTQKDIREVQLAKAAVRAGIETLILRYGIEKEDISKVYLAGGFGYKLNCLKAIEIGMIPKEFAGKIEALGNASLSGAVKYLCERDGADRTSKIGSRSQEINLSADKEFNQYYMEYMYFQKS